METYFFLSSPFFAILVEINDYGVNFVTICKYLTILGTVNLNSFIVSIVVSIINVFLSHLRQQAVIYITLYFIHITVIYVDNWINFRGSVFMTNYYQNRNPLLNTKK